MHHFTLYIPTVEILGDPTRDLHVLGAISLWRCGTFWQIDFLMPPLTSLGSDVMKPRFHSSSENDIKSETNKKTVEKNSL